MKKGIIFGICITTLILLIAPTISAQQYKQVEESIQIDIKEQIDLLINKVQNIDLNTNELEYYTDSIYTDFESLKENIKSNEIYAMPTVIGFILSTLISLILSILGTIIGMIFGPLLALFVRILTAPAVLLAKLISLLFGGSSETMA